jgi:hypothetical protein
VADDVLNLTRVPLEQLRALRAGQEVKFIASARSLTNPEPAEKVGEVTYNLRGTQSLLCKMKKADHARVPYSAVTEILGFGRVDQ